MARKTIMIDDIDGSEDAEEVTFALDGEAWRIDLSDRNRQRLRAALDEFIEAGVKITGSRARSASSGSRASSAGGTDTAVVRDWARANGHAVNERGRIPAAVVEAFEASR